MHNGMRDVIHPEYLAKLADILGNSGSTLAPSIADAARFWAEDRKELEELKKERQVTLGVGDGTGNLFVHGTYESIKIVQDKLFRLEQLDK